MTVSFDPAVHVQIHPTPTTRRRQQFQIGDKQLAVLDLPAQDQLHYTIQFKPQPHYPATAPPKSVIPAVELPYPSAGYGGLMASGRGHIKPRSPRAKMSHNVGFASQPRQSVKL